MALFVHNREVVNSSIDYMASSSDAAWESEWHADLLGCCSEPALCMFSRTLLGLVYVFIYMCLILSNIQE